MAHTVLHLCAVSILFGAAMSIMPESGTKTLMQILCTSVLIITLLEPVKDMDFDSYALESARLHEIEDAFANEAIKTGNNLNRNIIEARYSEYILDKAECEGLNLSSVVINTRSEEEGIWVPYSAEITSGLTQEEQKILQDILTADFGIPKERQIWIYG